MNTDHGKFMALAIEEARKGLRAGERPFGAVVVQGGDVIARKYSVVESAGDPTGHAEILAVQAATSHLKTPSLKGCTLYASCEPCPMCAGAIFASRIGATGHRRVLPDSRAPRPMAVAELCRGRTQ